MKKNFIRLIFIQIFLLASFLGRAQQIDSLIQVYHDSLPEEKIHVHFDKGYYNPGETIWWKAYLFTGIEPSIVSKNLYAELIDENGTLISRHTGPIIESGSAGSFALAANFAKDPVFFRAYTTNMLNGDTSFLYLKQIRIILPVKAGASRPVLQTNLQFLPESGGWVAGISSVIAFMATDQYGMPVKVSGQIKNKQGTKLLDFLSTHNGMGSFELVPAKDGNYTATWKDAMGKEYSTPLPAVQE
ncbi:MAG: hypothetical protein H7Y27_16480, partial [Gemmatimonadaceae bacterium]|nr:hypothetical protein [Chitinophagaceae bacterium]